MDKKEIICVVCPSSCHITVFGDGKNIERIEGNTCNKGYDYAVTEYIDPRRILTSTVKAEGYHAPVISVRSSAPVPKDLMKDCVEVLRNVVVSEPFEIGRPVVRDILGTGIDIILSNE